jgi:hypothetical protein
MGLELRAAAHIFSVTGGTIAEPVTVLFGA